MNRLVLCGHLIQRPKLAYTPYGLATATVRIRVRRQGPDLDGTDDIEGVASGALAEELAFYGESEYRVSLEGYLRQDTWRDERDQPKSGLRVRFDRGYFLDPVKEAPVSEFIRAARRNREAPFDLLSHPLEDEHDVENAEYQAA